MTSAACVAGRAPLPPPDRPVLRRLLLVPLLAPLVAVLLVGALNPRPAHSLRLLVWSSPALPIGVWIMVAATAGAGEGVGREDGDAGDDGEGAEQEGATVHGGSVHMLRATAKT